MHEAAAFYQEDLGVGDQVAENIARFIDFAGNTASVVRPNVWQSEDGEICRVYFRQWSQNSKQAVHYLNKSYYDPVEDEIFYETGYMGKITLKQAANLRRF